MPWCVDCFYLKTIFNLKALTISKVYHFSSEVRKSFEYLSLEDIVGEHLEALRFWVDVFQNLINAHKMIMVCVSDEQIGYCKLF